MKTILSVMSLMLLASFSLAEEQTYVREYRYQASDHDSKVTARNRALGLLKAGVVEEIVSYVRSESTLSENLEDGEQSTKFQQQINTLSAGFVKSKILAERWNGTEFWLKARVTVDPAKVEDEIRRQLELARSAPAQSQTLPSQANAQAVTVPPSTAMSTTANYSHYTQAAYLGQVLALIAPIKMYVVQFYMMEGRWPGSLQDIGFNADEMSDDTTVQRVEIKERGSLLVTLHERFGKDKWLRLDHETIMGGSNIRSNCTSNVAKKVTGLIAGCHSAAQ